MPAWLNITTRYWIRRLNLGSAGPGSSSFRFERGVTMRLQRPSCGRALLCLLLLSSFTAAGALGHGKRQETSPAFTSPTPAPTDNGQTTTPVPTASVGPEDITTNSSRSASSSPSSTSSSLPSPTGDVGTTLFNGTCLDERTPSGRELKINSHSYTPCGAASPRAPNHPRLGRCWYHPPHHRHRPRPRRR